MRSYNTTKNVVGKCALCKELTDEGGLPACVKACCGEARFYGDLDDPESDVSLVLAGYDEADIHQFADSGNVPVSSYILSERFAVWQSDDWSGLDLYNRD